MRSTRSGPSLAAGVARELPSNEAMPPGTRQWVADFRTGDLREVFGPWPGRHPGRRGELNESEQKYLRGYR